MCDRVAIIDHGKIVALDTPQNLIDSLGAEDRVVFEVNAPLDEESLAARFRALSALSESESGWWSMGKRTGWSAA